MARKPTPAQARVISRLNAGEVICAYSGVSRTTAFALVNTGLAEWETRPYTSSRRHRAGGRTRYQLEWGIRAPAIHWGLDPTVAERARYGQFAADLWATCEGDEGAWAVFELGHPDTMTEPTAQGKASSYKAAKQQAETALRRLSAPA
jgi:hypothetical protein